MRSHACVRSWPQKQYTGIDQMLLRPFASVYLSVCFMPLVQKWCILGKKDITTGHVTAAANVWGRLFNSQRGTERERCSKPQTPFV